MEIPTLTLTSTRPDPPRPKTLVWQVGDLVQVAGTRWIIRTIRGEDVELASSNTTNHGVWWTTTLTALPRKASA